MLADVLYEHNFHVSISQKKNMLNELDKNCLNLPFFIKNKTPKTSISLGYKSF